MTTATSDSLTTEEALAELARLDAEREAIHQAGDQRDRRRNEIKKEISELKAADLAAINKSALDGTKPPESPDARIAELQAEFDRFEQMHKPSRMALRKLEAEREKLHADNYDAFAAHAGAIMAEAVEALADLDPEYTEIREKWAAGKREWDKLVTHWNNKRHVNSTGKTRPKLVSVPECPLPAFESLPTEAPEPTEYVAPDFMPRNVSTVMER